MDIQQQIKCSIIHHENQKPSNFCIECNIFMCHQCFKNHKKNFSNHHLLELTSNISEIFSYICKEDLNKLEYFCKTDNQLICSSCKDNKHKDCEICKVEEIKEEKNENLNKYFNELENISENIKEKVNLAKDFYEKMDLLKEELKSKIMKIITNVRNKLNEREDELISEVDNIFSNLCPEEKLILNYEQIPKKINNILNKRSSLNEKMIDSHLLNFFISNCIIIENNYNEIKEIMEELDKYDINKEAKILFYPDKESEDLNKIYKDIKSFGKIYEEENDETNIFITENFKEIYELKSEIKKFKTENEQKDNKIKELKKRLDEIKSELNNKISKNNDLENSINKLNNSKIRFTICSRCALNKCLDMKSLQYGNSPHLWDYGHHNANQIFELEKNNDGTYSIKSSHSGLYLGLDSDRIAFRWKNENKQSFYLHHFGDGYYLIQEKSGGVIDLYGSNTSNGANIGKWSRNNYNNQQWKLVIHL